LHHDQDGEYGAKRVKRSDESALEHTGGTSVDEASPAVNFEHLLRSASTTRGNAATHATNILNMQRMVGNRAVQRYMRASSAPVQRHPAGAPLLNGKDISPGDERSVAAGPTSLPQMSRNRTQKGPAPGLPIPAPPQAMAAAQAKNILQTAYGSVREVQEGTVEMLPNRAALYDKFDQITEGKPNPFVDPERPWQKGDAALYVKSIDGFFEEGTLYINQQAEAATTTAHEMLHLNAAPDFRQSVGEVINEGATQYLAEMALHRAGIPLGKAHTYPMETGFVRAMFNVIGEATLVQAYFNGGSLLTVAFDTVMMVRSMNASGDFETRMRIYRLHNFERFKRYLDDGRYEEALQLLARALAPTLPPTNQPSTTGVAPTTAATPATAGGV
jgi:hypothetical protein